MNFYAYYVFDMTGIWNLCTQRTGRPKHHGTTPALTSTLFFIFFGFLGIYMEMQRVMALTGLKAAIQPLDTWLGIVGIKKKQVYQADVFATYPWTIQYEKCHDLRHEFKEVLTETRRAINGSSLNEHQQKGAYDYMQQVENGLNGITLDKMALSELRTVTQTRPIGSGVTCVIQDDTLLTNALCNHTQGALQFLRQHLILSATKRETLAATILNIKGQVDSVYQAQNDLLALGSDLAIGRTPDTFISAWHRSACQAHCPEGSEQLGRRPEIELIQWNSSTMEGLWKQPCARKQQQLRKYSLRAYPFEREGRHMQATLPQQEIWIDSKDRMVDLNEECSIDDEACEARSTYGRLESMPIEVILEQGDNMQEPKLDDIGNGLGILTAPSETTLHQRCGDESATEKVSPGIYKIHPVEGCSIRLGHKMNGIAGQILTAPDYLIMPKGSGAHLIKQIADISTYWTDFTDHLEDTYSYYVLALALILVAGTCAAYWRIRPEVMWLRRRTMVMVRTPTAQP